MNLSFVPAVLLGGLLSACSSTSVDSGGVEAAVAQGMGPQFYEVKGHGASAYLFGTVHMSHELTRTLPAPVEAAFVASDTLYVELRPSKESRAEMMALAMFDDDTTLDAAVGDELWARIVDRYERAGQPREAADALKPMRPWAAASMMAGLREPSEAESDGEEDAEEPVDNGPVLDRQFSIRAKERGMEVHGLETLREQLASMAEQTDEEQLTTLVEMLDYLDEAAVEGDGSGDSTIEVWYSGDAGRLYGLLDELVKGDKKKLAEQVEDLWERNERMIQRLDEALRASPGKTAFVAVGALHLPSPPDVDVAAEEQRALPRRLGFADLLRLRGYTVTRLNALK